MITPRDYQRQAVDGVLHYFANSGSSNRNPLIAMPTGVGKSVVIASFIQRALEWPQTRVWAVTHVKELIEQNADKLLQMWPNAPMGIVSAGLNRRDIHAPVIFGGIKTIANAMDKMVPPDIFWIDEAHLLSPNAETVYQDVIRRLRDRNPKMRVAGCTATPYRMGQGLLTQGETAIFSDIAVDQTTLDWFAYFVANGYIVPPRPRATRAMLAVAQVGVANGDYKLKELQDAVDTSDLNMLVCREMLQTAYEEQRRRGLVFCSGVDHAEHIAKLLTSLGHETHAVHLRTGDKLRTEYLRAHKAGEFPTLTNNNVLTTGYDDPAIDWIGMLRPTVSVPLWVQMLGRGTRPFPGKRDCLVMDFARNTSRLGPINDPVLPKVRGKGDGEAPVKICPVCANYCHASVRVCPFCNHVFDIETKIVVNADTTELFRGDVPEYKFYDIDATWFTPHTSKLGNRSIKVAYQCGSKSFNEYIDFEAKGFRQHVAHEFWRRFVPDAELPDDNEKALVHLTSSYAKLNMPIRVKVHTNRTYPEIVGYEYF